MSEVTSSDLEHQLEENKLYVDRGQRINRLLGNADFREIILENFSKRDAARYVQESCDPALQPEQQADALALAQASGHLKRYIAVQLAFAAQAKNKIPQIEEALAEVRAEEDAA